MDAMKKRYIRDVRVTRSDSHLGSRSKISFNRNGRGQRFYSSPAPTNVRRLQCTVEMLNLSLAVTTGSHHIEVKWTV